MPFAIGIDVGTTNTKVALCDADGTIAAHASRPLRTVRDGPVATQDAEALWHAVADAVTEVTAAEPEAATDVLTVGVCSQYSSTVAVDGQARPVSELLTYFDQRGTDHCLAIMERHPDAFERFVERHGIPPVGSGLSLAHILHLEHDRAGLVGDVAAYLEPMDYVGARLTGSLRATQATMFTAQVCDNRADDRTTYDDELLAMTGLDPARLPPLLAPGEPVGTLRPDVAESLGLPRGVVVATPMNDSHAGALATGAFVTGQAGVMIGTTAVLLDDVDHPGVDLDHEVLSMPSPVPGRYLVWAENGVAGKAIDHVLEHLLLASDELGDHRHDDRFARLDDLLAATTVGAGGVLFLPWLSGSLSPRADRSMRGGFLNLSLDTTRRDLVRAMVEGTAHNLAWLLPVAEAFAGAPAERLVFGGGAARSRGWAQILADVLDRPVARLFDPDHAVARAVAMASLHGAPACASPDSPVVRTAETIEPDPTAHATHHRLSAELVAAHEALAPICARLNR